MGEKLIYGRFHHRLWLDLETRNIVDINTPTYVDTAEILLFLWAIDDGPVYCWDVYHDAEIPMVLEDALLDSKYVKTHFNGRAFDCRIIRNALTIDVPPEDQDDVKETAMRYNLPQSLAKLGGAVGLEDDEAKDKMGGYWIDLFCIPLANKLLKPNTKYPADFPIPKWVLEQYVAETGNIFADPDDFPIEYAYFKRYGKRDVSSMRLIFSRLPKWNDTAKELEICAVNHRINERGLRIDVPFARLMAKFCAEAQDKVKRRIMMMTNGVSPSSHAKYKQWLMQEMPALASIIQREGTGAPVIERLRKEQAEHIPEHVAKVFDLQGQATASSLGKFPMALKLAHPDDDRVRYTINVRGAGTTGRYGAAGGLQVHNFKRPTFKKVVIDQKIREVFALNFSPDLLQVAPSMLRPMIIPSEGHRFRNADLGAIEGRMMAYLSGFTQQVEDYRNGVSAYFSNGPIFGYTYDQVKAFKGSDSPDEYNLYMLCKVLELALIYQGGVSAICSMGAIYGLNMPKLADMLIEKALVSVEKLYQAKKALAFIRLTKKGRNSVAATRLNDGQWMALDAAKRAWRDRHGPVVSFWNTIQRNLVAAFEDPGVEYYFGVNNSISMCFLADIGWFGIRLPSGRVLSYYDAKLGGASEAGYDEEDEDEEEDKDERPVLLYRTFDKQGKPSRKYKAAHAGKVANNINQGTAASLLDEILLDMEYEGWNPVLHIHDQAVADLPISDPRTPQDLEALQCRERAWCPGLPLASEGEYLDRFAK